MTLVQRSNFGPLFALLLLVPGARVFADERPVDFAREIQPLLAKHCFECHGPDAAEAGLRLTTFDDAVMELDSGVQAIVPGDVQNSELLRRVVSEDDDRMPPEGERLSAQEVDRLRSWIQSGAEFQEHWAYVPVGTAPSPPAVEHVGTVRNPIDQFIQKRLGEAGLTPSAEADRTILIKRLYYDLVGLPPTPAEVDQFVADDSEAAYEKLVDRLLKSPHFGERWGRHWLDKARYADSDGYEKDRPRPNAWRYRDWVIEAINEDLPYDQFTIQQLAGDLLPEATEDQLLATAFHRQTLTNTEGGTDKEQFRIEATFDRTETTAAVWLGLTMTCARCHTHKYDQITQREYYQLFAFFNDADETTTSVVRSRNELERFRQQVEKHEAEVHATRQKLKTACSQHQPDLERWLQSTSETLQAATALKPVPVTSVDATASSGAKFTVEPDGSVLASGKTADKDKYTLVFAAPQQPVTGIQIEVLPHKSLPDGGPGRAPNGNFVLTQVRAYASDQKDFKQNERLKFSTARADFSQQNFSADAVLDSDPKTGWAISPKLKQPHSLTVFLPTPVQLESKPFVQLVLDQQYGGAHTIGRFRVSLLTGYAPQQALPEETIALLRKPVDKRTADEQQQLLMLAAGTIPQTRQLQTELARLEARAPKRPTMTVRVLKPATRTTQLLHRGDFLQPADEVTPGTLQVVHRSHSLPADATGRTPNRLDLARWLVSPDHPLTGRVTVNQVWAHLFGRGIVPTVNDFGVRGERPTHPDLLDWLAYQFTHDLNWSRKELIRLIVSSATYRQSSRFPEQLAQRDPTNQLLARQNRLRVEAEIIRDLNLAVSGLLSPKIGGPSVFPPLPPGVAELSYANNFKWKTSEGEDRYRRGMYTFFKRTSPHPTLISFDCPDSNTTRLKRDISNTPLQALATLNNDVFLEAAQALAGRVLKHPGSERERLTHALRLCIYRPPSGALQDEFSGLLRDARSYYTNHPDQAQKLLSRHRVESVEPVENAAWVATVRMILNLDEFIVRD